MKKKLVITFIIILCVVGVFFGYQNRQPASESGKPVIRQCSHDMDKNGKSEFCHMTSGFAPRMFDTLASKIAPSDDKIRLVLWMTSKTAIDFVKSP